MSILSVFPPQSYRPYYIAPYKSSDPFPTSSRQTSNPYHAPT